MMVAAALGWAEPTADVLVVVKDGSTQSIPLEADRGFPVAPATVLAEALGYSWFDAAMLLDGDRALFAPGSPFFSVGDLVFQLPNPVYRDGQRVMIPVSWALEWLPRARARRWRYLDGRLVELPRSMVQPPERESWLVVIDAGHGGPDPGTIGVRGTKEKDITLAIAKQLAKRLDREPNVQPVLTRDSDTLIAFADRPRIPQLKGAEQPPDLFVSIHVNSMPKKPSSIRGVETYFLAVAKTEQARQVAERENAAIHFEDDVRAEDLEPLQFILADLESTGNLQESRLFASSVDRSLKGALETPSRGVKQAGFLVLIGAPMPAVLVEVGYLSNKDEEKLLRSSSYQAKIADALADAVVNYLAEYGRRVWYSYGSGG
jgi:N-acetylmuramoyl-L-alanine amidase